MQLEGCPLPLTVLFQTSRDPKSPQKISLMTLQKAYTDPLDALELVCHTWFFAKQKREKSKRYLSEKRRCNCCRKRSSSTTNIHECAKAFPEHLAQLQKLLKVEVKRAFWIKGSSSSSLPFFVRKQQSP